MAVYGIDVSHHQGDISWDRVAGDGIGFAVLKYTQGASYGYLDWLRRNLGGARAAGLFTGGYLFMQRGNGDAQGGYFVDRVAAVGAAGGMLILDVETAPDGSGGQEYPTAADADAAAKRIKAEIPGAKVGLYTGRWYWGPIRTAGGSDVSVLHGPPVPDSVDYVWESRYVSASGGWRTLAGQIPAAWYGATRVDGRRTDIVQYSAAGTVAGVTGSAAVDLDSYPGTLAQLRALTLAHQEAPDMTPEEHGWLEAVHEQVIGAVGAGQRTFAGTVEATLATVQGLVNAVNQVKGTVGAQADDEKVTLAAIASLASHVDAAQPGTVTLTDAQVPELAALLRVDEAKVADAVRLNLASALSAP